MYKSLIFLLFVLLGNTGFSQYVLLLEKTDGIKRHRFIEEQNVQFTYQDSTEVIWVEGKITKIKTDSLKVSGFGYAFDKILTWEKPHSKKRLPRLFRKFSRMGGRLFFGISAFNGVVNNDSPIIPKTALIVLAAGETLNLILKFAFPSHIDLTKEKWQLRSVNFGMEDTQPQK